MTVQTDAPEVAPVELCPDCSAPAIRLCRTVVCGGFPAHASAGADVAPAREAWADLREQTDGVWRLAIQPVIPHLEVHLRPPAPARVPAARLVGTIRGLAVRLAGD